MTLFLQYNVNNHIPVGAHYIRWPIIFPTGTGISIRTVLNRQRLAEFRTPYQEMLATPLWMCWHLISLCIDELMALTT